MKMRFLFFIALLLQILAWFPATCRLLPSPNHHTFQQPGTIVSLSPVSVEASYSSLQESEETGAGGSYRGIDKVGSRPPNCEHKCDSCYPCLAIQVPTITSHLGIQFANYEPESWKCKCGPSVYSP
ncbi:uncharacterized protein LOC141613848 [Silene latifolia]|uniref:uncharacterized protein LOC141613848 n=1 Tax=Silene latifolia TaxID=37657 RepID=UPI003D76C410